jgi:MATE family multidrug resistance protein
VRGGDSHGFAGRGDDVSPFNSLHREEIRGFVSESWAQSWPMTLITFFDFLVGITDIYIAGKVSKEIQAAYGFVIQFYFIFIIIGNALSVGTVAVISRLFSSGNGNDLSEAIYSTIVSTLMAGILFGRAGVLLTPAIIEALNIPGELKPYGIELGRIYASGLLFSYILINSNGILRACKRVRTSLKTMTVVCVINIILIFGLVFHTSLGYRGIALATVVSLCVGSIMNIWQMGGLMAGIRRFSSQVLWRIISIGWPSGLLQVLWQLGAMAIYLILSTLPEHSVEILAALATGLRIESAIFLPAFAFNMANAVIVGNLLGEMRKEDAFRGGIITAAMGVTVVAILTFLVIVNARWIVPLLSNDPVVITESVRYVYISMISEPFMAWAIILGGGLNGAGDTKGVMGMVTLSVWVVRIPLCYFFVVVLGFGATAVWWTMNLSQFFMALFMTVRYFRGRWLELKIGTVGARQD